jgi:NADH-quinone oxidoreductase subunit C
MSENFTNCPVVDQLREFDPDAIEEVQEFRGEVTLFINRERIRAVCEFLRETPGLTFRYLSDLTAVDRYPSEPRFEVVYHLLSLESFQRIRLKVRLPGDDPRVDSVVPVWPGAEAFENEVYDLFGVRFEGHPNLRRLLLPEDWEGHPLRKDYPVQGDITRWP